MMIVIHQGACPAAGIRVVPRELCSRLWPEARVFVLIGSLKGAPMFKSVNAKLDVPSMEENILKFWKKQDIFRKTVEQRKSGPNYVFYEGPPTANGRPGVHHVLARAFKDMFPRY